jgi:hypothetical protein
MMRRRYQSRTNVLRPWLLAGDRTPKAAIPPPQHEDQTMSAIDEYCRLIHDGALFDETKLAELREHMTADVVERVCVRLKREANAVLEAAGALGA